MVLRRAVPREAGDLADLWLRSRTASIPSIPAPVHSDAEVHDWFRTVVVLEREVWVAEVDGAVVALLVLHESWVDQLYVDPVQTGRGIGADLLELAQTRRPDGLQLWTFAANVRAQRFYERHGFIRTGATAGDNEEGAPDVRYEWNAEAPPRARPRG